MYNKTVGIDTKTVRYALKKRWRWHENVGNDLENVSNDAKTVGNAWYENQNVCMDTKNWALWSGQILIRKIFSSFCAWKYTKNIWIISAFSSKHRSTQMKKQKHKKFAVRQDLAPATERNLWWKRRWKCTCCQQEKMFSEKTALTHKAITSQPTQTLLNLWKHLVKHPSRWYISKGSTDEQSPSTPTDLSKEYTLL